MYTGWVRSGSEICYYQNSFIRNNTAGEGVASYFSLSFTLEFSNPRDTVLIAYSYPYTCSDYRSYITHLLDRSNSNDIIRQSRLCTTLSGEDCDLLVITNFKDKEKERIGPITGNLSDDVSTFASSKSLKSSKKHVTKKKVVKYYDKAQKRP